jgi:hypothetical protein
MAIIMSNHILRYRFVFVFKIAVSILLFAFTVPESGHARNIPVSSIAALQDAINLSVYADTIVLANGTYLNNSITVTHSNITSKRQVG